MDSVYIALFLAAGLLAGMFYHWGLWLTVRALPGSPRPALLSVLSFAGRMGAVLAFFYLAVRAGPWSLGAAVAGFLAARAVSVRRFGMRKEALDGDKS